MALAWTWWGVPGVLALVSAWVAAGVAVRVAPHRMLNRRLALLLALEGLWAGSSFGFVFFLHEPDLVPVLATVGAASVVALPYQYFAFLAIALKTPLLAPFRSVWGRILLDGLSVASVVVVLARPDWFLQDVYSPGWAPWNFHYSTLALRAIQFYGIASLMAVGAVLHSLSKSPKGTVFRERALWLVAAFAVKDLYLGLMHLLVTVLRPIPFWGDVIYNPGQGVVMGIYVVVLAYAVLRAQLFDIDLKLRLALQQGTVGALIAGVFLVASELLERFFAVDGVALGVFLALLVAFLLKPMQALAQRAANKVVPGIQATPEYLDGRRLAVYRAALEGAFEDGEITTKERSILTALREQLGIDEHEAESLERSMKRSCENSSAAPA